MLKVLRIADKTMVSIIYILKNTVLYLYKLHVEHLTFEFSYHMIIQILNRGNCGILLMSITHSNRTVKDINMLLHI